MTNFYTLYREYGSQTTEDGRLVKPWISLSGDDDGKHYLLYPESEDTDDWKYTLDMIIDTGTYYTVFENHRKSPIQHCVILSGQKLIKKWLILCKFLKS